MDAKLIADLILASLGGFISGAFSYFPSLATWYYSIKQDFRGLIMVGLSALVAVIFWAVSCPFNLIPLVVCDQSGILVLIKAWVIVLAGNQLIYMVSPDSPTKTRLEKSLTTAVG